MRGKYLSKVVRLIVHNVSTASAVSWHLAATDLGAGIRRNGQLLTRELCWSLILAVHFCWPCTIIIDIAEVDRNSEYNPLHIVGNEASA